MSTFREININSEGLIYMNTNLKIHALKVQLLRKVGDGSRRLLEEAGKCRDDVCLERVERNYGEFVRAKEDIEQKMLKKQQKYVFDYILCGDLIFDNDIKVCRRKVKQQYLQELAITVKQNKMPTLI